MITIDYTHSDFDHQARTLKPSDLGQHEKSGWTIEGDICEDYYEWVSDFVATHAVYGKIEGNFEMAVTCESQEAHDHFIDNHPFEVWDYDDI